MLKRTRFGAAIVSAFVAFRRRVRRGGATAQPRALEPHEECANSDALSRGWWRLVLLDTLICISLAAVVYATVDPFAFIDVDPQHDGLMFKVAFDLYHGAVPFRDTFSQYGLLTSLLHASLLYIFEPTLLVLRLMTVLLYSVTAPLMWMLCRLVLSRLMSVLAVLLWFSLAAFFLYPLLPWSSSAALPVQACMILLAARYFTKGNAWYLAASATMAAVIFWIRMPVGVVSLLSFLCVIAFLRLSQRWRLLDILGGWREGAIVLGAFFGFSAPFLVYLLVSGAFRDWFLQTFVMALVFARSIPEVWGNGEGPLWTIARSFFPVWLNMVWALLPALALLGFMVLVFQFRRARMGPARNRSVVMLVMTTFAVASWSQYYPVTEERHVFWGAMPLVPVAFFWVQTALLAVGRRLPERVRFGGRLSATATVFLALCVVAVPAAERYEAAFTRLSKFNRPFEAPAVLKGMYGTLDQVRLYAAMDRDIKELEKANPGADLITTGFDPLYLTFGTYRPNWHPLYVFFDIGVAIYPAYPQQLKEFVKQKRPIIISPGDVWRGSGYSAFAMYANGLNLLQPSRAERPFLLPLLDQTPLIDDAVPNFADLLSPMRQAGLRLPNIELTQDSTLEFVFEPAVQEREGGVLMATMFGPHHSQGFAIVRGEDAYTYAFYAARRERKDPEENPENKPLLKFSAVPGRCNYIVIRRRGRRLEVWRDGVPRDQARLEGQQLSSRNQFLVNTGVLFSQRYDGFVRQVRVLDRALTDQEILESSVFVLNRCTSSLQP